MLWRSELKDERLLKIVLVRPALPLTRYNASMPETKPFRLTESVKAAG